MMRFISAVMLTLLIVACNSNSTRSPALLYGHVLNEAGGLTRARSANNIKTTVTLRPPIMDAKLVATRADLMKQTEQDSLISSFSGQLTFIVNLRPEGQNTLHDIMYSGVSNVSEFKEQAYALNFAWDEMALLRCGASQYRPALSTLENTYGLTKDRNIILVFTPNNENDLNFFTSEYIHLEIRNDILRTGTQHFKFRRADLHRASKDN